MTKEHIEATLSTALALVEAEENAAEEGCRLIAGPGGPSVRSVLVELRHLAAYVAAAEDLYEACDAYLEFRKITDTTRMPQALAHVGLLMRAATFKAREK
jgi:hypothetical protein